ncbi:putative colanic acid biosynthesis acetyltransferase [Desulfomarina sp.]
MSEHSLQIKINRSSRKYSAKELVARQIWNIIRPLFLFSPRPFFRWRRFLLRLFGARIGKEVHIYNTVSIFMPWNLEIGDWSSIGEHAYIYNLGKITIGKKATISHRSHLCAGTHDYTHSTLPLLKPPIIILNDTWVCADAFIGPGVTISEGVVVGARAVVTKDVKPWTVVAGNPAKPVKKRIIRDLKSIN